jgi:co-chaperonin GroES (HSP10)
MIKVTKGNVLIEPTTQATNLGNGLQINNETQSRKDVVTGRVIDGEYKDDVVYFPLYAASPLTYNGINYLILNEQDILAYDSTDN